MARAGAGRRRFRTGETSSQAVRAHETPLTRVPPTPGRAQQKDVLHVSGATIDVHDRNVPRGRNLKGIRRAIRRFNYVNAK